MTRTIRAARIHTMEHSKESGAPVLENGALVVRDDRIAAVGRFSDIHREWPGPVEDLGDVTLAPGVINAHCHLELVHGKGRTLEGQGFMPWVASLLPLLAQTPAQEAVDRAAQEMRALGTVHVCDIATRQPEMAAKAMDTAELSYHLFRECIGFSSSCIQDLPESLSSPTGLGRTALAGHALYSTSPEMLNAAKGWDAAHGLPFSIHLAEHQGEVEMLSSGTGVWATFLKGKLVPGDYQPPGVSPVAYADSLGLLDHRTLAVHCVHLTDEDIDILTRRKSGVCLCPRSNEYIGVGRAPWEKLMASGATLCLGTDSLASNHDLDVWNEVRFLLENARARITLPEILAWLTANPAKVLGLENDLGALAPGRLARWSIVPEDVEEKILENNRGFC
jgi:aminodeoxyfutalosine deaminase